MIAIHQSNYVSYTKIKNPSDHIILYTDIFSGKIVDLVLKKIRNGNTREIELVKKSLSVGISQITGKIYLPEKTSKSSLVCVFLSKGKFVIENKRGEKSEQIRYNSGSVAIFGSKFQELWNFTLPVSAIKFYEQESSSIYLDVKKRLKFSSLVKKSLEKLSSLPSGEQCVQKYIKLGEMLGKGSYGNVFSAKIPGGQFAVKLSKLKSDSSSSWYEVFFLKKIIRPLIEEKICQNLPLLMDTLTCDSCELIIEGKKTKTPCITTIIEIANGNLKTYLKEGKNKIPITELYSAFFQILVALHAIQLYGQIMNFDVKKENVLFYNVEPGDYWCYRVHGKDFYVPNYGKLFILNDFGISRTMSPLFPLYKNDKETTFRLGSRYAIVIDGKFVPINAKFQIDGEEKKIKPTKIEWEGSGSSKGAEFRMLRKNNKVIPIETDLSIDSEFFIDPEVIPPFEFYNDTQDALRMFIGGKRTTQKGNHALYKTIPKKFEKELQGFLGKGESMKSGVFSTNPNQVLAGYLLVDFFTKYTKYLERPVEGRLIDTFIVS